MTPLSPDHAERAARFRALHDAEEAFVMPNPWNAGTARMLASLGYEALATTSAGFAHSIGRPDGARAVSREEAIAHARDIVEATDLPVNGDLEGGYGDDPDDVATTIVAAAQAGLAGCSIEDSTGDPASPIYPFVLAVARIEAAVEAATSVRTPFVVTARAENFLHGKLDLEDTIRRLQAFEHAGADVVYAPGLPDLDAIRSVVAAVSVPVNAVANPRFTIAEIRSTGVSRISIGSGFSRATFSAFYRAAREVAEEGTFGFASDGGKTPDFNALFSQSTAPAETEDW